MELSAQEIADTTFLVEQGQLDRARLRAQELLLLHPNSAPVHALMGDIAAASREHREAIDWYELALRLEHNPSVATRLDRERRALDEQTEAEIDQALAPRPTNRRLLMIAVAGGFVVIALLLILAASLIPRGERMASQPPGGAVPGRPTAQAGARPAAGREGLAQTPAGRTAPTGRPATSATRSGRPATQAGPAAAASTGATGQVSVVQSVDAPMSDRDRLLTQALSGITWSNGEALGWRVQGVVDDFTGYAMISLEVPPSMRTRDLPGTVISMAWRLAAAAVQADKGIQSLTVRVMSDVETEQRRVQLLAFRGNTTRENLDYYLKRGMEPDRQTIWNNVFATTWWNPSVPTGAEAAQ